MEGIVAKGVVTSCEIVVRDGEEPIMVLILIVLVLDCPPVIDHTVEAILANMVRS